MPTKLAGTKYTLSDDFSVARSVVSVANPVSVRAFGAKGDGVTDDTEAIQAAINALGTGGVVSFPRGVYRITSTLRINGQASSIRLLGETGHRSIVAGGTRVESASTLEWDGAPSGLMVEVDSGHGCAAEHLSFRTKLTGGDSVIAIAGVTGIRFINKSSSRMHSIIACEFRCLDIPIHFFDDGSNVSSDTNMDGHIIFRCLFSVYRTAIKIEQTNVYDLEISRCSLFGSETYAKHHIHVVKGQFYSTACYFGPLKNAGSVGGADGVSIFIENGSANFTTPYSEAHNGPFLDWVAAFPAETVLSLFRPVILNSSGSYAQTWNLRNCTNQQVCIVGGHVSKAVQQKSATTGAISMFGTLGTVPDSAGDLDRVMVYGAYTSASQLGRIGTFGTGQATIAGTAPTLRLYDNDTSNYVGVERNGDLLSFNLPGVVNGPFVDFASRLLSSRAFSFAAQANTPAEIGADQNNYNPSLAGFWRISADAPRTITGFAGGVDGRTVLIVNVGASAITIAHQSASSTAANRVITTTGADVALATSGVMRVTYDSVSTRWRQE